MHVLSYLEGSLTCAAICILESLYSNNLVLAYTQATPVSFKSNKIMQYLQVFLLLLEVVVTVV